jgi:hypothetical protein
MAALRPVHSLGNKALAAAAGVTGASKELPFLVILPIKSKIAYIEVTLLRCDFSTCR